MLRPFQQSYHVPGTLGANLSIIHTVAMNCVLRKVSAVASNNSDATLAITNASTTTYLTAHVIGDSECAAGYR